MKIHALTTGTVQVKRSFLFPKRGAQRQLGLFLPGAWADPLPIHCWAVEHDGVLRLVDTRPLSAERAVRAHGGDARARTPGRGGRSGPGA